MMCLSVANRVYLNTKEVIRSLVILICSQLPYGFQTHTFYFKVLEMEMNLQISDDTDIVCLKEC